jgi:hypothetical protein
MFHSFIKIYRFSALETVSREGVKIQLFFLLQFPRVTIRLHVRTRLTRAQEIDWRDLLSGLLKLGLETPISIMRKIAANKQIRWLAAPVSFLTAAINKLRQGAGKFVPVGYEDETGFHVGAGEPLKR